MNEEEKEKQYQIFYQNEEILIAIRVRDDVGGEEE